MILSSPDAIRENGSGYKYKDKSGMEIKKFKEKPELDRAAGAYITELVSEKEIPILLLLSGGSAFSILEFIDETCLGNRITIGMLDERYSKDPDISNFSQFQETLFYKKAVSAECRFIDTKVVHNESLEDLANRFERELKSWKNSNPDGKVIATMGIGSDGHTGGIMPFAQDSTEFSHFFEEVKWVIGYDAGSKNQYPVRITVTNVFLRQAIDYALMYISGENKKEIFDKLLNKNGGLSGLPASIIHEMKDVKIFTDIQ